MKRLLWKVVVTMLIASISTYAQESVDGWEIRLSGIRSATVTVAEIIESMAHGAHQIEIEAESKGVMHTYSGIPLYQLVAMVDGDDGTHPYRFDRELWEAGYDISLVASDGYTATFSTAEVDSNAMVVAVEADGGPSPPRIVGDVSKGLWVKDIVAIELLIVPADIAVVPDDSIRLVVRVNDRAFTYGIYELEASPYFAEGRGSYTTSAGTTYTSDWGGILLTEFFESMMPIDGIDTITMIATDGYRMSFSVQELGDESDGRWILAFTQDGTYLPEDPGPFRTIKVGPGIPDIPGHSSVRMIAEIELSGTPYREYTLTISGSMNHTLDRQTIQSGVSCHSRTVEFEHRSLGGIYTGIPLWRLLAYSDDPELAPHRQDSSIRSYMDDLAGNGYPVRLIAEDGFTIELDSRDIHLNDEVIIAVLKEGIELDESSWPMMLVWDKNAELIPQGAKPIRQLREIRLVIE